MLNVSLATLVGDKSGKGETVMSVGVKEATTLCEASVSSVRFGTHVLSRN